MRLGHAWCCLCSHSANLLNSLTSMSSRARPPNLVVHADLKNVVTLQLPHTQTRRKLRAQASPPAGKAPPPLKKGAPPPPAPQKKALPPPPPPAPRKPGSGTGAAEMPSAAVNDVQLPHMRNMKLVSAIAAWTAARNSASMSKTITCVIDSGAAAAALEAMASVADSTELPHRLRARPLGGEEDCCSSPPLVPPLQPKMTVFYLAGCDHAGVDASHADIKANLHPLIG